MGCGNSKSAQVAEDKYQEALEASGVTDPVLGTPIDGQVAVFVCDMSGCTRLTRKLGTEHFTSLIFKMRELITPYLKGYGGQMKYAYGDDVYAYFRNPADALEAALLAAQCVSTYNDTHSGDERVTMDGIGLSFGEGVSDLGYSYYGEVVDEAEELGENVAEGGEVLITHSMYEIVKNDPRFQEGKGIMFEPRPPTDEADAHYCVRGRITPKHTITPALVDYGHAALNNFGTLCREYLDSPEASKRGPVLKKIKTEFVSRKFVVMYGTQSLRNENRRALLGMRQVIKTVIETEMTKRGGVPTAQGNLYLFDNVDKGVEAVIAALQALDGMHLVQTMKGIALDVGDVLNIMDTEIQGDPANTGSKLADDTCGGGECVITKRAFEELNQRTLKRIQQFRPELKSINISKVDIEYYLLHDALRRESTSR
eukprot:TRINITY_DN36983_c0_g1_i1.p1 TRINITY_DN36983_c0_g1~~TRINITY_DN36983_c0_g1_i1.p1  ORF type:complete len:426 (+),score=86.16 TRINITY_DN36983_c0_g1_i1:275-1552(+)